MSEPRTIGLADISGPSADTVRRAAAEVAKTPVESDFKGKDGYYKQEFSDAQCAAMGKASGYYKWGCSAPANDGHGKLSAHAQEVGDMMRPSWEEAANKPGQLGSFGGRGRGRRLMVERGGVLYRVTPEGLVAA